MEPTGTISALIIELAQYELGPFSFSGPTILGFFLLLLSFWARGAYLSGQKDFRKIFEPRKPSLKEEVSPLMIILSGLWGGSKALAAGPCWWFLLVLGLDFLLFSGQLTTWVVGLFGY